MDVKVIEGFENYSVGEDLVFRNLKTGRSVKAWKNSKGYLKVGLFKDGKRTVKYAHRLIAEAFIPNNGNKKFIDHINNIRSDNRVENLRWVTHKENIQHAARQGRMNSSYGKFRGSNSPKAKLTDDHVISIKMLLAGETFNQSEIAVLFDVSKNQISYIRLGKRWSHLQ